MKKSETKLVDNKISVVIPTLQSRKEFLINLLEILNKDSAVDEIILIDNSLKGLDYSNPKLKIIIPKENLYVNPSWNYGVSQCKNDIVALINDDVILSDNFCSKVASKMTPDMGFVGLNANKYMVLTKTIEDNNEAGDIELEEIEYMPEYWGVSIFFYKQNYKPIPDEIKIVKGDTWLMHIGEKLGKKNYQINGQIVYHYGSLTHGKKCFNEICKNDKKLFNKYVYSWFERYIFCFEKKDNRIILRFLGIKFSTTIK